MGKGRNFPGGPVIKTLRFQCRGRRFDPWSENEDPTWCAAEPKTTLSAVSIYGAMTALLAFR